jgi:hypothetical protein
MENAIEPRIVTLTKEGEAILARIAKHSRKGGCTLTYGEREVIHRQINNLLDDLRNGNRRGRCAPLRWRLRGARARLWDGV